MPTARRRLCRDPRNSFDALPRVHLRARRARRARSWRARRTRARRARPLARPAAAPSSRRWPSCGSSRWPSASTSWRSACCRFRRPAQRVDPAHRHRRLADAPLASTLARWSRCRDARHDRQLERGRGSADPGPAPILASERLVEVGAPRRRRLPPRRRRRSSTSAPSTNRHDRPTDGAAASRRTSHGRRRHHHDDELHDHGAVDPHVGGHRTRRPDGGTDDDAARHGAEAGARRRGPRSSSGRSSRASRCGLSPVRIWPIARVPSRMMPRSTATGARSWRRTPRRLRSATQTSSTRERCSSYRPPLRERRRSATSLARRRPGTVRTA